MLLLTCPCVALPFSVGWTLRLEERVLVFWRWPHDAYTLLIAWPSFGSRQSRAALKATFSLLSLEGDDLLEVTTNLLRRLGRRRRSP